VAVQVGGFEFYGLGFGVHVIKRRSASGRIWGCGR
jgi:hypothetical protein